MNKCFLCGRIVSKIDFNFVYNSKYKISKVDFILETIGKNDIVCNIKMKAYNDIADKVYSEFNQGELAKIIGRVEKDGINILDIAKF